MKPLNSDKAAASLKVLQECGLLKGHELEALDRLNEPDGLFRPALSLAETVHLHIKVDDTHQLPVNEFFEAGARLDHQKDGFVKYRFPGNVNAIFSHIRVSQDELTETQDNRRPRPFLDHVGVDLRDETDAVRQVFDSLPGIAAALNWAHASQGGSGRPVYCCHVEVAKKHWLYPPDEDKPGIPLEFAYGALKVNPDKSGCDLRPANPAKTDPASISCCGGEAAGESAARSAAQPVPAGTGAGYYQPQDLGRFSEIARTNPRLAEGFFAYYGQVMADGNLTRREKALIALAVSHALKCPYCIDNYTSSLHKMNVGEAEMSEAVHVASAMSAGITLVHGVQMMNKIDQLDKIHASDASQRQ
ncbi:carboxymuconolactone decarboxylase family protein [bacterium]|nr:carboxymuconolactone decarboxylase family protein [bacterium]